MITAKLKAAIQECLLHADILHTGYVDIQVHLPFNKDSVQALSAEQLRILDQLAYRFGKLQDSMGEKVLPGLLTLVEEPLPEQASFMEKLQRLERLQAIPSANTWKILRQLRNEIAHEYPDAPEIRAVRLNSFIAGVADLLAYWGWASEFAVKNMEIIINE